MNAAAAENGTLLLRSPLTAAFAGWRVALRGDDAAVYAAARRLFGAAACDDRKSDADGAAAQSLVTVRLHEGAEPLIQVSPIRDDAADARFQLIAWLEDKLLKRFVRVPDSTTTSRRYADASLGGDAASATLEVEGNDGGTLRVLRRELWPLYLQLLVIGLMQTESGTASLHAAVLSLGGRALVLQGVSGAGKSTLSAALHHFCGADFYGDEWAFFTLPDYALYAWPRPLALRPGGQEKLGAACLSKDGPVWRAVRPDDVKWRVALPEPTRPCPRHDVVFLFLDGFAQTPLLEPLSGGEASRRLLTGLSMSDPSVFARLGVAADLANRYPCWRLLSGTPADTASLIAERLEKGLL